MQYWNGIRATFLASLIITTLQENKSFAIPPVHQDMNRGTATRVVHVQDLHGDAEDNQTLETASFNPFEGDGQALGAGIDADRTNAAQAFLDRVETQPDRPVLVLGGQNRLGGRPNASRTGFDMTRRNEDGTHENYSPLRRGGGQIGHDRQLRGTTQSVVIQTQARRQRSRWRIQLPTMPLRYGGGVIGGRENVNRLTGEGTVAGRVQQAAATVRAPIAATVTGVINTAGVIATGVTNTVNGAVYTADVARHAVVGGATMLAAAPSAAMQVIAGLVPYRTAATSVLVNPDDCMIEMQNFAALPAEENRAPMPTEDESLPYVADVEVVDDEMQPQATTLQVAAAPGEPDVDPQPGLVRRVAGHAANTVIAPVNWLARGTMGIAFTYAATPVVIEGVAYGVEVVTDAFVGPYLGWAARVAIGGTLYQLPQLGEAIFNVGWDLPENIMAAARAVGTTVQTIYNGQLFEIDWARRARDAAVGGAEYGARGGMALTAAYYGTPMAAEVAAQAARTGVALVMGPAGFPAQIFVGATIYGSPLVGGMMMRAGWRLPEIVAGAGHVVVRVFQIGSNGAQTVYGYFYGNHNPAPGAA